ncbi:MAG: universal stress protein [Burkholderiales bacterium]
MYKKILVPVDGSHTAIQGLQEAVKLAKSQQARLRLLHVVDEWGVIQGIDTLGGAGELLDALEESGKKALADAETLAKRHGVRSEAVIRRNLNGRVADFIVGEARKWGAHLIVMGTHGRRGISHALLGSDAEAVVRSSPVPVLLVRGVPSAKRGRSLASRKK